MRNLTITINHEDDCPSPEEGDCNWKMISFINRHASHQDAEQYIKPNIGLRRKLEVGLAFYLDYHEHGNCVWCVSGHHHRDQWDSSPGAGIMIFQGKPGDMGAKTLEDRRKDADAFCEMYTDWCNGNCNWYRIEDQMTCEEVEQGNSFIGTDDMCEEIAHCLQPGDKIMFDGDGDWLKDYIDLPEGVEIVSFFEDLDEICQPEYVI